MLKKITAFVKNSAIRKGFPVILVLHTVMFSACSGETLIKEAESVPAAVSPVESVMPQDNERNEEDSENDRLEEELSVLKAENERLEAEAEAAALQKELDDLRAERDKLKEEVDAAGAVVGVSEVKDGSSGGGVQPDVSSIETAETAATAADLKENEIIGLWYGARGTLAGGTWNFRSDGIVTFKKNFTYAMSMTADGGTEGPPLSEPPTLSYTWSTDGAGRLSFGKHMVGSELFLYFLDYNYLIGDHSYSLIDGDLHLDLTYYSPSGETEVRSFVLTRETDAHWKEGAEEAEARMREAYEEYVNSVGLKERFLGEWHWDVVSWVFLEDGTGYYEIPAMQGQPVKKRTFKYYCGTDPSFAADGLFISTELLDGTVEPDGYLAIKYDDEEFHNYFCITFGDQGGGSVRMKGYGQAEDEEGLLLTRMFDMDNTPVTGAYLDNALDFFSLMGDFAS